MYNSGWPKEVSASPAQVRWDDSRPANPGPLDSSENGFWDHLGFAAPSRQQLHPQVSYHFHFFWIRISSIKTPIFLSGTVNVSDQCEKGLKEFLCCSDLALRNCLLTSDLTVRIGDYGLSHNHYKVHGCLLVLLIYACWSAVCNYSCCVSVKDDYYLTPDKLWIPLRWIAPELLEEYRGSLIVTDQTKTSNVWYVWKSWLSGALQWSTQCLCLQTQRVFKSDKKNSLRIIQQIIIHHVDCRRRFIWNTQCNVEGEYQYCKH